MIKKLVRTNNAPISIEICESKIEELNEKLNSININKEKNLNSVNAEEINNLNLLLKYKELLDKNVITKEEFEKKKKELIID